MSFTLYNGHHLPEIGFGTFRIPDGQAVKKAISTALHNGYRNIDTATLYGNESGIGEGLKSADLPRAEYTVTTKVWNTDQGYDETLKAFDLSQKKLGLDEIDLYLVHWPIKRTLLDTWRAMETLYAQGRVKAIGVSNFSIDHLSELMDFAAVKPAVNQIEFHPQLQSPELVQFCNNNGILVQAWAPLMRGQCRQIPVLRRIAEHHHTTPEAICLAWIGSQQIMPLPKSSNAQRIKDNIEALSHTLSASEMDAIKSIDKGQRLGPPLDHFWK